MEIGKIVSEGEKETIGYYTFRISRLDVAKEATPGDTINFSMRICNRYEHSVDFKTELITYWNKSSVINYATAPPKPAGGLESYTTVSNNFIMPNEPGVFAPRLSIKENDNWILLEKPRATTYSIIPKSYPSFMRDYFDVFDYPFVCKVAELDGETKFSVAVSFINLGTLRLWQQVGVHIRWTDDWLWSPITQGPTQGRGSFGFHCDVYEMPEEDAIIDFHLQHSENWTGPWETGITKIATIKPVSDFGSIDIKNVVVPDNLLPGTKPDYFNVSATVSNVKKFFFLIKDRSLIEDVTNVLVVEKEVEGDTEIIIDPETFFTETMPNRNWILSLQMATEGVKEDYIVKP